MNENSRMPEKHDAAPPIKTAQAASGVADLKNTSSEAAAAADPGTIASGDAADRPARRPFNDDGGKPSGGLADLLRISRSELDGLLAETRNIQERSWKVTQSLLEGLQTKTWQAVESALSGFQKEVQDRVGYEVSMILENLDMEAGARLAARVDQTLAKAKDDQRDIEQRLSELAAENQKTAVALSAQAAEEMQRRAAILRTDFQNEAKSKIEEVKRTAHESAGSIREIGQAASDEIGTRTEQVLMGFQPRLAHIEQEAVSRAEKRINEMTKSAVAAVAKQAQEAADREVSRFFLQALRSRLDQLADIFKQPGAGAGESKPENGEPRLQAGEPDSPELAAGIPEQIAGGHVYENGRREADGANGSEAGAKSQNAGRAPHGKTEKGFAAQESSFKKNFESRYGSERSYSEYAPAYRFGYDLAADSRYRGKDWLSIEPEVKRAWETQGGGKWEKFKGSIQSAWLSALGSDQN
jgi:hypothetical protein